MTTLLAFALVPAYLTSLAGFLAVVLPLLAWQWVTA